MMAFGESPGYSDEPDDALASALLRCWRIFAWMFQSHDPELSTESAVKSPARSVTTEATAASPLGGHAMTCPETLLCESGESSTTLAGMLTAIVGRFRANPLGRG